MTAVQVLDVGDDYLEIGGLDAMDGMSLLDIKPTNLHSDRIGASRIPGWVDRLAEGYF